MHWPTVSQSSSRTRSCNPGAARVSPPAAVEGKDWAGKLAAKIQYPSRADCREGAICPGIPASPELTKLRVSRDSGCITLERRWRSIAAVRWQFNKGAFWPTRMLAHTRIGPRRRKRHGHKSSLRWRPASPQFRAPKDSNQSSLPSLVRADASRGRGPITKRKRGRIPRVGTDLPTNLGDVAVGSVGEPMAGKGGDHEVANAQEGAEA